MKVWFLFVGIVVFLSIIFVVTAPNVSSPRDKGVTSKSKISVTSPAKTPPWIAAPIATHSMGSTPPSASFPKTSLRKVDIIGILVGPPTRITLLISFGDNFASSID